METARLSTGQSGKVVSEKSTSDGVKWWQVRAKGVQVKNELRARKKRLQRKE